MSVNLEQIRKILVKAVIAQMKSAKSGVTSAEDLEDVKCVRSFLTENNLEDQGNNNQLVMIVEKIDEEHRGISYDNVFFVDLGEYSEAKRDHTHPAYWAMMYVSHILDKAMSWEPVYETSKKYSFSDTPEVAKQLCTRCDAENTIPSRVIVYDVYS